MNAKMDLSKDRALEDITLYIILYNIFIQLHERFLFLHNYNSFNNCNILFQLL